MGFLPRPSLFLWGVLIRHALAQWDGAYCRNEDLPIVLLRRDSITGEFSIFERFGYDESTLGDGQFRQLEASDLSPKDTTAGLRHSWAEGIIIPEHRQLNRTSDFDLGNDIKNPAVDATASPTPTPTPDFGLNDEFFYARECSCFAEYPVVYCPFTVDICQRPKSLDASEYPGCLTYSDNPQRTRFLFFFTLIFYSALFILLIFSRPGQNAIDYMISCCLPGWLQRRADHVWEYDPYRTAYLLRRYFLREHQRLTLRIRRLSLQAAQLEQQRQRGNEREGSPPLPNLMVLTEPLSGLITIPIRRPVQANRTRAKALALKTQIYHTPTELVRPTTPQNLEEDDMSESCIICFAPLVDGDRVGSLKCGHVFHGSCLKTWLQRRNCCPLCQEIDIATPCDVPTTQTDGP